MMLVVYIFAASLAVWNVDAVYCSEGCELFNMSCNQTSKICMCDSGMYGTNCELSCNEELIYQTDVFITREQYGNYMNCTWTNLRYIKTTVVVTEFDVEHDYQCYYDDVTIRGVKYCGHKDTNGMPRTFVLYGNDTITFRTDETISAGGFRFQISYEINNCPLEVAVGYPRKFKHAGLVKDCAEGTMFDISKCTCVHLPRS